MFQFITLAYYSITVNSKVVYSWVISEPASNAEKVCCLSHILRPRLYVLGGYRYQDCNVNFVTVYHDIDDIWQ
jgi:hypothetical protein